MNTSSNQMKSVIYQTNICKRNNNEEFNRALEFMQYFLDSLNSTTITRSDKQLYDLFNQVLQHFTILTTNEYFHMIFINNAIIKKFIFNLIEMFLLEPSDCVNQLKAEMLKIIENLIEWEVDVHDLRFRSETSKEILKSFYLISINKLIEIGTCVKYGSFNVDFTDNMTSKTSSASNYSLSSQSPLTITTSNKLPSNQTPIESLLQKQTSNTKKESTLLLINSNPSYLSSYMKVMSYMFVCVPYECLVNVGFYPQCFNFLFDQYISPKLYAGVSHFTYSIFILL
jgi:hypothetical protein